MIDAMLSSPLFGLSLTCAAWAVGQWVQRRTGLLLLNPVLVSSAVIILVLAVFHIPYAQYEQGGALISLMLGPVTAVLALNVYEQRKLLREYFLPVLAGCVAGCLVSVGAVLLLCKVLAMDGQVAVSLLPKSVTTAIAIAISESGGGLRSITAAAVMVSGITGAVLAPFLSRLFRITDPAAEGVALGACSHALGTAKALERGQLQGAMSSISLCVCGILTSAIALFLP